LKKLSTESPPAVLLAALVLLPCWLSLNSHPDWLMRLGWAVVAASFLLVAPFIQDPRLQTEEELVLLAAARSALGVIHERDECLLYITHLWGLLWWLHLNQPALRPGEARS
jgi:GAF domain-containing protein